MLCELEARGEWYLDREGGLLYVLPPAGVEAEGMEVSVVRDPWQFEDATVFIGCRVRCPETMRVAVRLGYDGPIKAFMDGQPIFHDPEGRLPAHPDQATPECALAQGDHDLVIALSANRGQSWGVFLRIARVDRDAELMRSGATLLPEIRPDQAARGSCFRPPVVGGGGKVQPADVPGIGMTYTIGA